MIIEFLELGLFGSMPCTEQEAVGYAHVHGASYDGLFFVLAGLSFIGKIWLRHRYSVASGHVCALINFVFVTDPLLHRNAPLVRRLLVAVDTAPAESSKRSRSARGVSP